MNHDARLKLQAFLDGQLPPGEASAMQRLIETDPEARTFRADWTAMKRLLAVGEPVVEVPASREQYWHEIARQLEAAIPPPRSSRASWGLPWWLRVLAPVTAGVAVIAALILSLPAKPDASGSYAEVESPLNDVGAMIFRSESERMTVVWVDTR
ncbi:MAG: hypothetical protein H7A45_13090 [Verrucomicrobiales bacterium]|nr:hypothetical protein [Verrucomicrobiales bacterium]